MSTPSSWPLPDNSLRYVVNKTNIEHLQSNILTRGLYPLAFGLYQQAFGHEVSRNNHNDNLLIFCTQGRGEFRSRFCTTRINPGDVLLVHKDVAHFYKASNKAPWTIYWMHINGHLFEQFAQYLSCSPKSPVLTLNNTQPFIDDFEQLLLCGQQGYQMSSLIYAANIVKKMFAYLCQQFPDNAVQPHSFELTEFDAFIQENMTNSLTLEQMAEFVGLSKFHFAKKFQASTGISPVRYFLEKKVQHACQLLDSSQEPVKSIASQLGYDDAYYFSRLFKKIMGMSPKHYRQSPHRS